MGEWQLRRSGIALRRGAVIAYPTEAVWGLGCNPFDGAAVERILRLKGRPIGKGLILIADDFSRLADLIAPLSPAELARVFASWPGPVTWLLPARPAVPYWLCGDHATLAVRVTAHPVAAALCRSFGGALVSTSANRAGHPAARSAYAVRREFGQAIDQVVAGPLGGRAIPSEIRSLDGRVVRPG